MYTVQQATIFNERLYAKINDKWYIIGTGVKHVECLEDEMRVFTEFSTIPADISYKISFEEDKGIRIITSFIGMVLGEEPLKLDTIIETSDMVVKDTPEVAHFDEEGNLKFDKVNSPNHYKLRGLDIEAIDVIRGALTEDEFRGFCKGNVLKYTIREGHKNGDEDLKKAKKYLDFLEKDDSDE